jgi:hypothetical protein
MGSGGKRITSEAGPEQKRETLPEKLTKAKRAKDVAKVGEHLPKQL